MGDETDAVKESAKAVQEVAKVTGKAIDAGKKFGGFISRYISGPLEQGIGIFEDKLKYMRWNNQQRLMKRAEEFMTSLGLREPTRPILLKLAVPLFQAALLEDDNYLQDMWAKLLVNSATLQSGVDLKRAYIDILERLTPLEAQILEKIYSLPFAETQHNGVLTAGLPATAAVASDLDKKKAEQPGKEVKLALANLSRLGCVSFGRSWGGGEIFTTANPTLLGRSFVAACTLRSNSEI